MKLLGIVALFIVSILRTTSFPVHERLPALDIHGDGFQKNLRFARNRGVPSLSTSSRGLLTKGVTFDVCKVSDECKGSRQCVSFRLGPDGSPVPEECAEDCFCYPGQRGRECKTHSDCDEVREVCGRFHQPGKPDIFKVDMCMSMVTFLSVAPGALESVPGRPGNPAVGKTMYPCRQDEDCRADRLCVTAESDDIIKDQKSCSDFPEKHCYCMPPKVKSCSKNGECEEGEVCAILGWIPEYEAICVSSDMERHPRIVSDATDVPVIVSSPSTEPSSTPSLPASPSVAADASPEDTPQENPGGSFPDPSEPAISEVSPSTSEEPTPSSSPQPSSPASSQPSPSASALEPSPTEDPICIDAAALSHLSPQDLVFKKHTTATVLCDANGSCATRGHIVVYNGKTMMMRTYCSLKECDEKKMKVNSPKYKRGMLVGSNTSGLAFTVFAARYATTAEEAVIRMAVRVGL